VRRVIVAGSSGAGKTTLARRISGCLGIPHVEIDALFHGPNWEQRPSFVADVDSFSAGPAWVTEWQYDAVKPLLADRADTLVWLHFRRTTVMWRVMRRTVVRRLRKEVLWNGNQELPLLTFFTNKDHVIRWAWRTHAERERQLRAGLRPGLHLVELRTQREVDRWVASL
jgi:adenylate kinase family enzyme